MKKKAHELEFISQIKRDGSGTAKVKKSYLKAMLENSLMKDEDFELHCLSLTENTFEPRKSISERYSLENMAKQKGVTVEEFNIEIDKQLKMKQDIIDKQLSKGWTQEQAETHALRCLYIDGFSGPTFKD